MKINYIEFANTLRDTAVRAGLKIMEIRSGNLGVQIKGDSSPVTIADQEAEKIILKDIRKVAPDIPIIAEESVSAGEIPETKEKFWLVDPLDGTKEFIGGGTDFTVNIALIENGEPTFGIIYVPATGKLYTAFGSEKAVLQNVTDGIINDEETTITIRPTPEDGMTAVASKSHMDEKTASFLEEHNIKDTVSVGSSLKFCIVATGGADIYPRFGPTMEWDIAAGHAILKAAGGTVTNPDGSPFEYQKKGYLNGAFIAKGNVS
ncbi:3'(2'),5'-bisphosphate nucleotidase CysQ [Pseudemcibacter aquimaris]|uniref:3'(2'),5'-bisphosphate nucleotidase CysQ n=1 Tax=Pseudemcibacter aquimaris TaxID=2857064 RepID=UPI002012ECEA|nr:3'(2'),5'-bisphosphate nucleotidase CysQ [Pseudemcibacter aquimaris]MCC3862206.1 3'(2'),5'-bisphosphate nucleotidase CysQ [Pseudemcibacter aquimaris]WDU58959.1 3'(2'),5'-bisphosphate nucleotidase CysQ [Pseudemcibacter aquimaris]